MHTSNTLTSNEHEEIVIARPIKDSLPLNIAIGIGNLGILAE